MLSFLTGCPPGVRLSGKLGLWTLTSPKWSIPLPTTLPLHRDARRIAYLDPEPRALFRPRSGNGVHRNVTRSGSGTCNLWGVARGRRPRYRAWQDGSERISAYHMLDAAFVGCRRTTWYVLQTACPRWTWRKGGWQCAKGRLWRRSLFSWGKPRSPRRFYIISYLLDVPSCQGADWLSVASVWRVWPKSPSDMDW